MIIVKAETEEELIEAANEYYLDRCGERSVIDDYLNFFGPDYYALWIDYDKSFFISGMIVRDKLSALSQQKKQIEADIDSLLDYV